MRERSLLSRLASNTAAGFAGNSLQRGITFVITLVLARGLGEAGFGLYSYVISYMFLFSFLADLGIERVVTREVARTPQFAGELVGTGLMIKLVLSLIAMAAAISAALAIGMSREALLCVIFAAIGFPMSIEVIFRGYFQSHFKIAYTYAITLPGTVWTLAGALLVTALGWPVYALFALGLVIAPVIAFSLLWTSRYRFHLALTPRWSRMRAMLRDSLELGAFSFIFMLTMRLDQVMIHHLRGDIDVGRYAVGVRLSEALGLIPEALVLSLFPLLVSSQESAPERFHHTYRLGFKYLAALGILVALSMTVLRLEVIELLFGAQYLSAAPALAILSWNMLFGYIGIVYLSLFVAQARQRLLLVVSAGALAVNVVLNLVWIPTYGAAGAAAATLVANIGGFLSWFAAGETRPFMLACVNEAWRPAAVGAAIALFLRVGSLDGPVAFAVLIFLYPLFLWAAGGLGWSDVELVQRLFAERDSHAVP